jgi:hypothetical protein
MRPLLVPDTGFMSDEFHFGQPARHPARLGRPKRPRAGGSFDARIVWVAAGLVLAGVLAFVFLRGADEAGRQIAGARSETVEQIDRAYDAAARGMLGRAVVVARSLYAEHGSFTTDLATLSAFDPGVRFTSGSSEDPSSIAYSATDSAFAAAVRSESGTCWWLRTDAGGATTYGSGAVCTGDAAMGASAASW